MKRYEPRTPATRRALLKSIFNMKAAKKVGDIEKNVLKLEETYKRYEIMSPDKLPDDIKTVIMIELCTPELKEHLEFNSKDVTYKETREAVLAYVERKRGDITIPMEVGSQETYEHAYLDEWWFDESEGNLEAEVNYYGKGGGKGKGPSFGPKGKGKSSWKGGGKPASATKGGKSKGVSGKGGGFQGSCHWCGKWGHSDKDAYMDWVRSSGNNVKGPTPKEAYGVQNSG